VTSLEPAPATAAPAAADPSETPAQAARRREESVALAAALLRIDSTNGNETAVAELLAGFLADSGVEAELVARDPRRANVVARIPGTGGGPSLAFVGHSDVVPADARDWTHPPFGAVLDDDGYLWGRGAVDMKNEVAARTAAFASLARTGWRGTGDLVLLVVADEEDGSAEVGMNWIVHERPDLATTYAVNEGGGIAFSLADGRHLTEISVGEKGTCPVRVDALGEAGHASTPRLGDNAVPKLGMLLAGLGRGDAEPQDHPQVRVMLETLLGQGSVDRLGLAEAIRRAGALHPDLATSLPAVAGTTMSPTLLHGSAARNVMPARAGVELDCRILPGTTEAEVLAAVRRRLGDEIAYELTQPEAAVHGNWSTSEGPLWDAMARFAEEHLRTTLYPTLCSGFTDSVYLRREFGTVAYGFSPFVTTPAHVIDAGYHNKDERVHVDDIALSADFHAHLARELLG
jgi:acetylornithine deacetylase/succinyl-diaminopimelate desuccinylase-like protein